MPSTRHRQLVSLRLVDLFLDFLRLSFSLFLLLFILHRHNPDRSICARIFSWTRASFHNTVLQTNPLNQVQKVLNFSAIICYIKYRYLRYSIAIRFSISCNKSCQWWKAVYDFLIMGVVWINCFEDLLICVRTLAISCSQYLNVLLVV